MKDFSQYEVKNTPKDFSQYEVKSQPQQQSSWTDNLGNAAKNVGNYVLGTPIRAAQGVVGEAAGGIGDVFNGIFSLPSGNVAASLYDIGKGVTRSLTSPLSGVTNALTKKSVVQLGEDTAKNIGSGIGTTVEGIKNAATGLYEGGKAIGTGQFGKPLEQANQKIMGSIPKILGGTQQALYSPAISALEKTPIGEGFSAGMSGIKSGAEQALNAAGIDSSKPEMQAAIDTILQIPGLLGAKTALGKVKLPTAQTIAQAAKHPIVTVGKVVKPVLDANKAALGLEAKIAGKVLSPVTGLTKLTKLMGIELLAKNAGIKNSSSLKFMTDPKNAKEAQAIINKTITPESAREVVKNKFDALRSELTSTGKEYKAIREGGQTVQIPANTIGIFLKNNGIQINSKGRLVPSLGNTLSKTDLGSLQDIVDLTRGKTKISANDFLNLRKKIDNMNVWKEGQTPATKAIATELRKTFDQLGKSQLEGLENADTTYAPIIKDLNELRKGIFDDKGNFKEGATSKIANWTSKKNKEKLQKIEKIIPGITKELKALQAAEDFATATENIPGKYARNITGGTALLGGATGNLPLLAVGGIMNVLTHPEVLTRILQQYGKGKQKIAPIKNAVSKYIDEGYQMSKQPIKPIINAANQYKKDLINQANRYKKDFKNNMGSSTRGSIKNPFAKLSQKDESFNTASPANALIQEAKKYKSAAISNNKSDHPYYYNVPVKKIYGYVNDEFTDIGIEPDYVRNPYFIGKKRMQTDLKVYDIAKSVNRNADTILRENNVKFRITNTDKPFYNNTENVIEIPGINNMGGYLNLDKVNTGIYDFVKKKTGVSLEDYQNIKTKKEIPTSKESIFIKQLHTAQKYSDMAKENDYNAGIVKRNIEQIENSGWQGRRAKEELSKWENRLYTIEKFYNTKKNQIENAIVNANKIGNTPIISLDEHGVPVVYFETPKGQISFHIPNYGLEDFNKFDTVLDLKEYLPEKILKNVKLVDGYKWSREINSRDIIDQLKDSDFLKNNK